MCDTILSKVDVSDEKYLDRKYEELTRMCVLRFSFEGCHKTLRLNKPGGYL